MDVATDTLGEFLDKPESGLLTSAEGEEGEAVFKSGRVKAAAKSVVAFAQRLLHPTLLVAALGLALSSLAWVSVARNEDRDATATFQTAASNKLAFLQEGFVDFADVMGSYSAFVAGARGEVDRRRLERFATPLAAEYKGIAALAWVPRVSRAERRHFEASARRLGDTGYRIFQESARGRQPADDRSEYFPVLYASPSTAHERVVGFDVGSDPAQRAALQRARDSGDLAVSAMLPALISERRPGFIAVRAVYREDTPLTIAGRRRELLGFTVEAFELGRMVDETLARLTKPLGFHTYIYRLGASAQALPLYVHTSLKSKVPAPPLRYGDILRRLHVSGDLALGNQTWRAVIIPTANPASGLWEPDALVVFVLCLTLTILAASYTSLWCLRRSHDRALSAQLRRSNDRLSTIFNAANDGIVLVDPDTGSFVEVNRAGGDMFGYAPEELVGFTIGKLSSGIAPYTQAGALASLANVLSGGPGRFEWHAKRRDGGLFWIEISVRIAPFSMGNLALAVLRDITEHKEAAARIAQLAHYDQLTGLANRRVFVEALELEISRVSRGGEGFAVLYLDLDHFKDVNDTLGHPIGDLLLKGVAERLRSCVRAVDTVARFGGDEFALIVTEISDLATIDPSEASSRGQDDPEAMRAATIASSVADKILALIAKPFELEGNEVRTGASIGIALYGPDSPSAESMLAHADVALYRAKSDGRGASRFFSDTLDAEVRARVEIGRELRVAIAENQFYLLYQPQVDIGSRAVVGLEALVRWRHPLRGDIGPDDFIPAAETNGLIVPLGECVLREVCEQIRQWLDTGVTPPPIGVNLSGLQFKAPIELEANLAADLARWRVPARLIELELTESVLMAASREHNDSLLRLRRAGHRIAIDDFGTGYSSLDYLRRYPVDRIKIAQNFVIDIGKVADNDAIVRAALGLARELGIEVVVEGVETAAQLDLLRAWGAKIVQGYYFSRPLPADETLALLRSGSIPRMDREPGLQAANA
jgi:PAS domain S-box-containing protein